MSPTNSPRSERAAATARVLGVTLMLHSLLSIEAAWSRVGGGQSYSGDRSSGGGSSFGSSASSGDIDIGLLIELGIRFLFWSIEHPKVAIPLILIVLVILYFVFQDRKIPTISHSLQTAVEEGVLSGSLRRKSLRNLRSQYDPNFSLSAFLDFATQLFTTIHQARGNRKLEEYSLFLSEAAQRSLEQLSSAIRGIEGVLVGSIEITQVSVIPHSQSVRIDVRFEANYTETLPTGAQSFYTQETWSFTRRLATQSPSPEKLHTILCPNCGAAPSAENGKCRACGAVINTGQFTWTIQTIQTGKRENRPPLLTVSPPEVGTDLPTLFDPEFAMRRAELQKMGPSFDLTHFEKRATEIFTSLQKAWSTRNWALARPLETDNLFQSHAYWIAEYKKQKLINQLDQLKISSITPVRIEIDAFYVAITARISASVLDTTVREEGGHVCGDPKRPRKFTEYWTFIRS